MNVAQLANAAKMFFPKYADQIDKAQQMAGQFQASPDGVKQLMQQCGKTQEDLQKALGMLNNPMISGALNRIQPGLVAQLKQAGQQLNVGTPPVSSPSPAQNSPSPSSSLDALRARLGKL